uniref:Uncharacterized protein n=1 Tax=Trichobilharzia regenti TaxID=157069 RepID=A0AA85JNJ0_TRIRE|nr:unnamed protein product [Trichobilharzia regenti]
MTVRKMMRGNKNITAWVCFHFFSYRGYKKRNLLSFLILQLKVLLNDMFRINKTFTRTFNVLFVCLVCLFISTLTMRIDEDFMDISDCTQTDLGLLCPGVRGLYRHGFLSRPNRAVYFSPDRNVQKKNRRFDQAFYSYYGK